MNEKELLEKAIARIHTLCAIQGISIKDDPFLNFIRLEQENKSLCSAATDTLGRLKCIVMEINEQIESSSNKKNKFYQDHLKHLENKIIALQQSPETMFLPLGTVVRFNGERPVANSLSILPELDWKSYPIKESIGVVTKLNHRSEYPIGVSMIRPFEDCSGEGKFYPGYDSLITYNVDRELLEVVEQATLPDGQPFTGYGWIPTHHVKETDRDDPCTAQHEMILYADNFYWRLHDFGGQQSVECLQSYERLEEMSWIGNPLEAYTNVILPKP